MQSNGTDELNPDIQARQIYVQTFEMKQKEGQNIWKKSRQDDLKDESALNNPLQSSKKKEFLHNHSGTAKTRKEIYHKEQDEQDDELQEAVKPSKKLHLEAAQEKKVNIEPNKSAFDVVSTDVKLQEVLASLNNIISKKNILETFPNNSFQSFQSNQPLFPENFKVPEQDILNIGNYVLSYQGSMDSILQSFFGDTPEGQLYGLGLDHITFPSEDEEEDEGESEMDSVQDSEDLNSGTKSISVYSGECSEI